MHTHFHQLQVETENLMKFFWTQIYFKIFNENFIENFSNFILTKSQLSMLKQMQMKCAVHVFASLNL